MMLKKPHVGFYENRARAYHPGLGRFMSEDPMGFSAGDANLYRYCGNDPVNGADPTGLVERDSWKYGYQNNALGQGFSANGFWSDLNGFPTGVGGTPGGDGSQGGGGRGEGGNGGGSNGGNSSGPNGAPGATLLTGADVTYSDVVTVDAWSLWVMDPGPVFSSGEISSVPGSGITVQHVPWGSLPSVWKWMKLRHPELTNSFTHRIQEGHLVGKDSQYDWNGTKDITLDPDQILDMEHYAEDLAHELLHAQCNWITNWHDAYEQPDLTANHFRIYQMGEAIGREYAREHH